MNVMEPAQLARLQPTLLGLMKGLGRGQSNPPRPPQLSFSTESSVREHSFVDFTFSFG